MQLYYSLILRLCKFRLLTVNKGEKINNNGVRLRKVFLILEKHSINLKFPEKKILPGINKSKFESLFALNLAFAEATS
jgi:hypothetical protein